MLIIQYDKLMKDYLGFTPPHTFQENPKAQKREPNGKALNGEIGYSIMVSLV